MGSNRLITAIFMPKNEEWAQFKGDGGFFIFGVKNVGCKPFRTQKMKLSY